jgi:hypothetical protein
MKIGEIEYKPSVNYLIVDSGTSLNMLPDDDFYYIFNNLIKEHFECYLSLNTLTICKCSEM